MAIADMSGVVLEQDVNECKFIVEIKIYVSVFDWSVYFQTKTPVQLAMKKMTNMSKISECLCLDNYKERTTHDQSSAKPEEVLTENDIHDMKSKFSGVDEKEWNKIEETFLHLTADKSPKEQLYGAVCTYCSDQKPMCDSNVIIVCRV